jgi:hypothetical protein
MSHFPGLRLSLTAIAAVRNSGCGFITDGVGSMGKLQPESVIDPLETDSTRERDSEKKFHLLEQPFTL